MTIFISHIADCGIRYRNRHHAHRCVPHFQRSQTRQVGLFICSPCLRFRLAKIAQFVHQKRLFLPFLALLSEIYQLTTNDILYLGAGYVFNAISWIFSVLITAGVVITGISADQGKKWAAGNRAYRRIPTA